jgi:hypothetical protein
MIINEMGYPVYPMDRNCPIEEKIMEILKKEIELYQSLFFLSKKERRFILKNDINGILAINILKEREISRIKNFDSILKPLWESWMSGQNGEQNSVIEWAKRLSLILIELQSFHNENQKLLKEKMIKSLSELNELKRREDFLKRYGFTGNYMARLIDLNE